MNTLITGGSGLLGSYFTFGIKTDRKTLNLFDYDAIDAFIKKNNITKIIHTAAKVGGVKSNNEFCYDFFSENVKINMNIMEAAKNNKIEHVLFLLSTCIFPENASLPLTVDQLHDGEPHPSNFAYAFSKRMIDVGSRAMNKQYGIKTSCLIPCNLYGKNDNYHIENGHVIPSLIHKCYMAKVNNTPFVIWGSGNAEREFIYAADLANIIFEIICKNTIIEKPMIVSPGFSLQIKEIVELIAKIMNFKGNIIFDTTKPEGILRKPTDNTEFKKLFSNYKFVDIENGLAETIQYFESNYSNIRK